MTKMKRNDLRGVLTVAHTAGTSSGAISLHPFLGKLYEFIRDTSLLIATIAVAHLANIFQSRQQFLESLREQ
jgi:hypothetical protein